MGGYRRLSARHRYEDVYALVDMVILPRCSYCFYYRQGDIEAMGGLSQGNIPMLFPWHVLDLVFKHIKARDEF